MKKKIFVFILLAILPSWSLAADLSGYAWSENIGWVKFSGANYGVTMDDVTGELSGYAWSENIGWIKFNGDGPASWSGGLIKLFGDNYGVVTDANSCRLKGWAWGSDVIGWVHFNGPGYGVKFPGCAAPNLPVCSFSASPTQVASGGKSTLTWDCHGTASSCFLPNIGSVASSGSIRTGSLTKSTTFNLTCTNDAGDSNFSTKVSVVRPNYCEIIPFLGTCK